MEAIKVKISTLKSNTGQIEGLPKNPRTVKNDKFEKLKTSLIEDPEMLELREVIAYDNNGELVVICGNMRLKALKELGIKEVSTKILPTNTSVEKLKAYTIKDNIGFGEHDWEMLANEWDVEELEDWGLEMPISLEEIEDYQKGDDEFQKDIDEINDDNCELPIVPDFFETHECFIIPIHNEIDEKFIRDMFDLDKNYKSESGDKKIRKTNVINIDTLKQWAAK